MFDIKCDSCGTVYHTNDEHLGKHIKCNCGRLVAIRDERIHAASASMPAHPRDSWNRKHWYHRWQSWTVVGTAVAITIIGVIVFNQRSAVQSSGTIPEKGTSGPVLSSAKDDSGFAPAAVAPEPPTAPCRASPNRPLNGTRIQADYGTTGNGTLTVHNGMDEDAVVALVDIATDEKVRYAYIGAHQK